MAPELISETLQKFLPSIYVSICVSPIVARQWFSKLLPRNEHTTQKNNFSRCPFLCRLCPIKRKLTICSLQNFFFIVIHIVL
jgi:hypothetical protein